MENFNKSRFLAYGAWDLAINKKLYKNIAVTIFVLYLGITTLGFFARAGLMGMTNNLYDIGVLQTYSWLSNAVVWVAAISAGFMFHNLLTRQSRITELTIPASYQEKFWWHLLIAVICPLIVSWLSFAVCDLFNMALTAIFFSPANVQSMVALTFAKPTADDFMNMLNMRVQMTPGMQGELAQLNITKFIEHVFDIMGPWRWILAFVPVFMYSGFYSFINSIKYKNNIPLSIVISIAIFIILVILITVSLFSFIAVAGLSDYPGPEPPYSITPMGMFDTIWDWIVGISIGELILGIIFWIGTWFKFKKAQLITATNK